MFLLADKGQQREQCRPIVHFKTLQSSSALEFLEQNANFIFSYRKYHSQLTLTNPVHITDFTVPTIIPARALEVDLGSSYIHWGQISEALRPNTESRSEASAGARNCHWQLRFVPARLTSGITNHDVTAQ